MKQPTLKEKLKSWFYGQLAKGAGSMITMLLIVTILIVLLSTLILKLTDPEGSWSVLFWNNASTVINAWMPELEEEGRSSWHQYLIVSLVAIGGLFITSMLISILSNSLEEKMNEIRCGKRLILDTGHIVILGAECSRFYMQEIREYAGDNKCCLVIADTLDPESADSISDFAKDMPRNITVHVRNVDITDAEELYICSIPNASQVIIHTESEEKTMQAVLAVSAILRENPESKVRVITGNQSDRRTIPAEMLPPQILMVPLHRASARTFAHCCFNPVLNLVIQEFYSFRGLEFYVDSAANLTGLDFGQITRRLSGAVPMGISRDGRQLLNPPKNMILEDGDQLIYCAEHQSAFELKDAAEIDIDAETVRQLESNPSSTFAGNDKTLVIFGVGLALETFLEEIPDKKMHIIMIPRTPSEAETLSSMSAPAECNVEAVQINSFDDDELLPVLRKAERVMITGRQDIDDNDESAVETADADNMIILQKVLALRMREQLDFMVSTIFVNEKWKSLAPAAENCEIEVKKDIRAMILCQAALNPLGASVIIELLRGENCRLISRSATMLGCADKKFSVLQLRTAAGEKNAVLLGFMLHHGKAAEIKLNPQLEEEITLSAEDELILIA